MEEFTGQQVVALASTLTVKRGQYVRISRNVRGHLLEDGGCV